MLKIVSLILAIGFVHSVTFDRPCRTIQQYGNAHAPFDASRFLGTWYEVERYENEFQTAGDCVTAQYTLASGILNILNTKKLVTDGRWETDNGWAVVSFPNESPVRGML